MSVGSGILAEQLVRSAVDNRTTSSGLARLQCGQAVPDRQVAKKLPEPACAGDIFPDGTYSRVL